jgi:hypothetical protein
MPHRTSCYAAAAVIASSLACGGGGGSGVDANTSKVIGAAGGTVSLSSGPSLTIPAGALSTDTTITIAKSSSNAPDGALGSLYQFGPEGTVFTQPVTVALPVPAGTSAASIYWTKAGSSTEYESLPAAITGTSASALVSHFSAGFVGASCTEDETCTPASACHVGAMACGTGAPVCADTGADAANGASCGAGGTCQAGACVVTYGMADLAGAWDMNVLVSPGPGWSRGPVTIAEDGSYGGSLETSDGTPYTGEGTLAISSEGVVTLVGSSTYRGVMDVDKTISVGTDTSLSGDLITATSLHVFVKPAQGAGLSDLAGTWEVNSLATGPGAPWWERARVTISGDGTFTGTTTESDDDGGAKNGAFAIASDGTVTVPGAGAMRGVLDAGKTVMVMTDTWSGGSPGTTELKVAVKMAGTYGPSDLVGTWELNALASGPGAPWWDRARFTIGADGSCTGTETDSTGYSQATSRTLSISSDGVVTMAEAPWFRGVMDAGKTIVAGTDTWSSGAPGTTGLEVLTKVE